MVTRRSLFVPLLTVIVLLVAATAASAHIYCVGVGGQKCSGPVRPANEAGLIQAFSDAQSDNDTFSIVRFGAPNEIVVDTPISVGSTHPITFQGVHDSGIDANIEWTGASGTFLTIDNSAAGKRGSVEQVNVWADGDSTALRVRSTNVIWCNFSFGSNPPDSTPTAVVADSSNIDGGLIKLGWNGLATRGISVVGPSVDVNYVRFEGQNDKTEGIVQSDMSAHRYTQLKFEGVVNPLRVERGTMTVVNSFVQLGVTAGATAAAASSTSGEAVLKLGAVTIAGGGPGQTALRAVSNDPGSPSHVQIDSTLVDLRGSDALFAACSRGAGGVGAAGVDATYSLFDKAPDARAFDAGCGSGVLDGDTNIDSASHPPVYASGYVPAAGSPMIDAANPAPDLAGTYRPICSVKGVPPRMDIGAFENTDACPPPPWSRPDFDDDEAPMPDIDWATGTFRSAKHPRGLRVVKKRPKRAHFTVRVEGTTDVTFALVDKGSGYRVGKKCAGRPHGSGTRKRCDRVRDGRVGVTFPEGTSYLVFDGLWNHKRLASGHYRLRGILSDDSTFGLGLKFRR